VSALPPELMDGAVGIGLLTVSEQPEVAKTFIKFMTNAALVRKGDMGLRSTDHSRC
jgi:hypothetical protein